MSTEQIEIDETLTHFFGDQFPSLLKSGILQPGTNAKTCALSAQGPHVAFALMNKDLSDVLKEMPDHWAHAGLLKISS